MHASCTACMHDLRLRSYIEVMQEACPFPIIIDNFRKLSVAAIRHAYIMLE